MTNGKVENGGLDNLEVANKVEARKGSSLYVYYLTCITTIGGFMIGYDIGVVSGSMLLIGDNWKLSNLWKEGIVSATIGAAAIFSLVAGFLTDLIGRKKVVMVASVIFTIGAGVMGAAPDKEVLIIGRLIVGAAIGFTSMSVPVYVAEAAPSDIRGRLVTVNQLFITIGILVSSIVAGLFSVDKENGWRYMLGLAGIPSIIQFIGFLWLPESPRWLVEKDRVEDARKVLIHIRKTTDISRELDGIKNAIAGHRKEQEEAGRGTLVRMLKTQHVRRALILGCGMQMFAQLSGINTVIYYSGSILRLAGFPVEIAIWLVCVPNTVNCLCTFIGIWLVERAGRRVLTMGSIIGVMVGLAVLGVGFQLSIKYTPEIKITELNTTYCAQYNLCEDCITDSDCGFCYVSDSPETTGSCLNVDYDKPERYAATFNLTNFRCNKTSVWDTPRSDREFAWADSFCPTKYSWMAVLGMALFVMGFAPGLGPMPWTINSEIYPTWARSTGNSMSTATTWVCNLVVSLTFLTLLEHVGKYGTYWLYFGICGLGLTFMFFFLKETKNKSLEEVQELFMSKKYKAKLSFK